jgi:catecholate siderophore receptor
MVLKFNLPEARLMRRIALIAAGCALGGSPSLALAQDAALAVVQPGTVDAAATRRFDIPAQPLPDALRQFARQSGVRVQVDARAAEGVRSHALAGEFTAGEALDRLLAGTGLTARFTGVAAVEVVRPGTGVYALTPLTVVGARSRGYATTRTSTATKTETVLRDVPQSVSLVTREAIADQAMQGMADVVRYVPGVTMGQGEGHRDAPTIRGNSSTADFFVDGVRDDVQYYRDLYNTERVEVLKGSNALVFGRGGGGGVINRVTKEAQWTPVHTVTLEGGSFDHRRALVDVGQGLGGRAAVRLNGVYENSGGFRDRFTLERRGINPTAALALGERTTVRAGYEYFVDERSVDRGIPSFEGRPSRAPITLYFGNPDSSYATARVHSAHGGVEHVVPGVFTLRNRTVAADYDKFYQNSYPSAALNAAGTTATLGAYNLDTRRSNLFNQTDLVFNVATGRARHTLLLGAEVGRQITDNFRETGFYNGSSTAFNVPVGEPTVATSITFRQNASDADNRSRTTVAGVYVQDQVELTRFLQLVGGVRYDRFNIDFHNNRNDESLGRGDELISPRAGVVLKPVQPLSLYGSYSVSYLPSSGDQFASLTATTQALEPEEFTNREVGAKWDVLPGFALTAAAYRLDRTNTTAPSPNDPKVTVQTGAQRTTGWELGAAGNVTSRWQMLAGLARQDAEITSTTSAAKAGARVALVPEHTFSLWNRVQLHRAVGVGVGVVSQSEMFAAIDNTVTLPGFTRADAALFVRLGSLALAQVNVENVFDTTYYPTSHGNNNIMPGASRTIRFSLSTRR